MNGKMKPVLLVVLALVLLLLGGCVQEGTAYDQNDKEGYRLSVRYDANGGFFTTNTSVIVDAYDPAALPEKDGKGSLALLAPDDAARGNDAFTPVKNGYFLAGWYAERTETKDANGDTVYTYGRKWDFAKDKLEVDKNGEYSAADPVLTLYASWIPLFTVEFYGSEGQLLDTYAFDPTNGQDIQMPGWNEETGAVEMYNFPKAEGYTYLEAYYEGANNPITGKAITHPGKVNEATGTAENTTLKLNVAYREGEWYRISTVEQFLKNASVTGSYEICADLDFEGQIWPTVLMYGNYSGTILGNGHTVKNVTITQTNNSKTNAGLFGVLTDDAKLRDLKLENVTFTIQTGTRVAGTSYGLLAGTVSGKAEIADVTIASSALQVDSKCYFGTEEYVIGLICGSGETAIDPAGITVKAVGDAPEKVKLTVDGQSVAVQIALD